MELEQTYTFRTDTGTQNENRALTLSALQRIIVVISEEHLENIGLDVPHLMREYGVSWVLLSISAEIKSPIRDGERLSVRTWHTEKRGVYFRREVEICHADGSVAAVAATFSSIFDMKTRRLSTDPEVLEKVNQLGNGKELLDAESRIKIKPDGFPVIMTQKVMPSWIDSLGHVNNFRYGDLITDALPDEARANLGNLSRYEIGFTGELRLGESVELRLKEENGEILAAGIRSTDEKPAFLARLKF
ncbi:MAG: hypothetical protein E7479_02995 [Ruminococcaceae bacterium]|nr:hypothetical protein [Oscillospiraceae bacterium]